MVRNTCFKMLLSIQRVNTIITEMWQPIATETMAIYHWNKSEFCYRESKMPGEDGYPLCSEQTLQIYS